MPCFPASTVLYDPVREFHRPPAGKLCFELLSADHRLAVGIVQALMIDLKSLLFHLLQKKDHKETMAENSAVLILLAQILRSFLRAKPCLLPRLRLAGHIEKPLDPADS